MRRTEADKSGGQGSEHAGGAVRDPKRSWVSDRKDGRINKWALPVED